MIEIAPGAKTRCRAHYFSGVPHPLGVRAEIAFGDFYSPSTPLALRAGTGTDSLPPTPQPVLREAIRSITCRPENISKSNGVSLGSLQQPVFRHGRLVERPCCRRRIATESVLRKTLARASPGMKLGAAILPWQKRGHTRPGAKGLFCKTKFLPVIPSPSCFAQNTCLIIPWGYWPISATLTGKTGHSGTCAVTKCRDVDLE